MGILNKISLNALIERFGQSFKRFPMAMMFIIFLTGYVIYLNHHGSIKLNGFDVDFFLVFYPASGAILAVALSLMTEDFKHRLSSFITQVLVHAVWLVVSIYLARFDRFSMTQLIAVSATVVAMSLAVFLICFFYRKDKDIPFWNFSVRTALGLIVSIVIGGLLTIGLFALIEMLKLLFNMVFHDTAYGDIAAVCMVFLAPVLFMNLIPRDENKYLTQVPEFPGFVKSVVQYLFLPLLGLYMLTLYTYGAMIWIRWSLPVGGVSYLVTGSMVLMILLIYITYPVQHLEGNRLFKRVTRWLPVVMLPLLALMTIAIWRRLSDYGITVSRLYLLVFNLWCYAVCLWLIFTRNKRIWMIPASFAVILFLISVGPQSIANITRNRLQGEAQKSFSAAGFTQLPLSADQYEAWLAKVDKKTAASIDSKLEYIEKFYGYDNVKDLVEKDVVLGRIAKQNDDKSNGNSYEYYSNSRMIRQVGIPAGYSQMEWIEMADDCFDDVKGDVITIICKPENGKEQRFELNVKTLIALDQTKWGDDSPDPLILQNGESSFAVNRYTLSMMDNKKVNFLNIEGVLFTK